MPVVVAPVAATVFVALVLLALAFIAVEYWIAIRGQQMAASLGWFGSAIASFVSTVDTWSYNFAKAVTNTAIKGLIWAAFMAHDAFVSLVKIEQLVVDFKASQALLQIASLGVTLRTFVYPFLQGLRDDLAITNAFLHGFVALNINALNFWRAQITNTMDHFVLPHLAQLTKIVADITSLQIPKLVSDIADLAIATQRTLPAEIAETKTDVSAVQRVIQQTLTAPRTGLLDRAITLERGLAQVLPIAGILAIPFALTNLARLARDPCYCTNQGDAADYGALLLYLFEESS